MHKNRGNIQIAKGCEDVMYLSSKALLVVEDFLTGCIYFLWHYHRTTGKNRSPGKNMLPLTFQKEALPARNIDLPGKNRGIRN